MKKRILKKLCKKIVELRPEDYGDAKLDEFGCFCVCIYPGGVGETNEYEIVNVLEDYKKDHYWYGMFGFYPDDHVLAGFPICDKKKLTGKRMIEMARR